MSTTPTKSSCEASSEFTKAQCLYGRALVPFISHSLKFINLKDLPVQTWLVLDIGKKKTVYKTHFVIQRLYILFYIYISLVAKVALEFSFSYALKY